MIRFKKVIVVVLLMILSTISLVEVDASSATTYTTARNRKGFFVITQDAYLPETTVLDLGLDSPEDIFIDELDHIFIADTSNQRVVVYDPSTNTIIEEISYPEFISPKGVFITQDNELYVADSTAEAVFRFDADHNFVAKYTKPDSASFDAKTFNPRRIAVDNQGTMYVIAEGVFDGIIQLSSSGEFQGFFSTNTVNLTTRQQLENLLFTDTQLAQVVDRNPVSFSNVYVDQKGIKYSTSIGLGISNLKKHNTDGSSSIDTDFGFDWGMVDVYTDQYGIMYVAGAAGYINIFTSDGQFIFAFGTDESEQDVSGFYSQLTSIAVDSVGRIWTLDQDNAFLQSYTPTDYSQTIYQALALYKAGKYDEAVVLWEEVLKLNQLSVLAHNEMGRNLFSEGRYAESMEHFILSGNRQLYSQAYWEVRNVNLQRSLPVFIAGFFAFLIGYFVIKGTNRKYHYLDPVKKRIKKVTEIRIINDVLYMFNLLKHPLDSFYYIKKKEKGSYKGATIIFALFFISYMTYVTSKGFIYQSVEAADLDLNGIIIGFFAIAFLFVFANYLVTSINDGEGSLGEIFKGLSYSLLPIMVAMLITTYLSYKLTYTEVIILQLTMYVGYAWSGLLIFLAVQELHNYTIRETIKSFLLTFLFMMIVGLLFAFIQIMGDQLIQFVIGLVKEAFRNVFS